MIQIVTNLLSQFIFLQTYCGKARHLCYGGDIFKYPAESTSNYLVCIKSAF